MSFRTMGQPDPLRAWTTEAKAYSGELFSGDVGFLLETDFTESDFGVELSFDEDFLA